MSDRFQTDYGLTLEQFRGLSQANRQRVIRKEAIEPEVLAKACPVHGDAAKKVRAEYRAAVKKQQAIVTGGVGWHFRQLAEQIIEKKIGCDCGALAARLDSLGPEKCREQLDALVAEISANLKNFTWIELAKAAMLGATHVWEWSINPLRPLESMLLEAIRRAEQSGNH